MIHFSVLATIDLLSGIFLLFTVSPVPALFAALHAKFLIFKGLISYFKLPGPILPIFTLGIAADIISAAILLTGKPPILGDYKVLLAGALFAKGFWSLIIRFS